MRALIKIITVFPACAYSSEVFSDVSAIDVASNVRAITREKRLDSGAYTYGIRIIRVSEVMVGIDVE